MCVCSVAKMRRPSSAINKAAAPDLGAQQKTEEVDHCPRGQVSQLCHKRIVEPTLAIKLQIEEYLVIRIARRIKIKKFILHFITFHFQKVF